MWWYFIAFISSLFQTLRTSSYSFPANICLDEDVLKTSFVFFFFRRRLQQDLLINTKIFISVIRLQGAFKTFSRRLQDHVFKVQDILKTSSKRLQDVLQNCLQDIFKTFSTCIIKLNCSSRCHTAKMTLFN